jgi:hypothetical protein
MGESDEHIGPVVTPALHYRAAGCGDCGIEVMIGVAQAAQCSPAMPVVLRELVHHGDFSASGFELDPDRCRSTWYGA